MNESILKTDPTFKHIETKFTDKIDIDLEISKYSDFQKRGFSFVADNENLPFKDAQFDLYIASLSLNLVGNYKA